MSNVAIYTPTSGNVKATFATSLAGLLLYFMTTPVPGREDEERGMTLDLIIGSVIIAAREQAVDAVLRNKDATHLLFIDDDMGFKSDCLNLALSRRRPVVLANYRRKSPPWSFTAIRDNEPVKEEMGELGLEEVTFGGFGFCLLEIEVLRALKAPRFLNHWKQDRFGQWVYTTEDFAFFDAVHKAGFPVLVDHELSHKVWHVGDYVYHWHQHINDGGSEVAEDFGKPDDLGYRRWQPD